MSNVFSSESHLDRLQQFSVKKKSESFFHKISKEIKYLPGIVAMFHLHRIFLPAVSISPCVLGTDFSLRLHTNVFPGQWWSHFPPSLSVTAARWQTYVNPSCTSAATSSTASYRTQRACSIVRMPRLLMSLLTQIGKAVFLQYTGNQCLKGLEMLHCSVVSECFVHLILFPFPVGFPFLGAVTYLRMSLSSIVPKPVSKYLIVKWFQLFWLSWAANSLCIFC